VGLFASLDLDGITVTLMHSSSAVMQVNAPLEMLPVETAATDNIKSCSQILSGFSTRRP